MGTFSQQPIKGNMAAIVHVAKFGRRINIGAVGMALTRSLLILIYSGFRDQSFPWLFGDILI